MSDFEGTGIGTEMDHGVPKIGRDAMGHTLWRLAEGLRIYDVTSAPRGEVRVEHVGTVP